MKGGILTSVTGFFFNTLFGRFAYFFCFVMAIVYAIRYTFNLNLFIALNLTDDFVISLIDFSTVGFALISIITWFELPMPDFLKIII